ncbi:MAG: ABC transporter permease, partial [Planctomycetota bacterium]
LGSALLVVGGWQIMALTVTAVRGVEFPTPWETAVSLAGLLGGTQLAGRSIGDHVLDTLLRWAWGFGIAAAAAIAYGLLAGCRRGVEELTAPIVHMPQLIPGLAWIPVALLVFGIGERAMIFISLRRLGGPAWNA